MTTPSPTDRLTIGVIGGKGMLGTDLTEYFGANYTVTQIDRDNYDESVGQSFDLLINANGNSKRFWALEHPFEDFEASTVSVYKSLFDFKYKTYVYISTADTYEDFHQPSTTVEDMATLSGNLSHYGFHKLLSERLVQQHAPRWLIVRSCMILGTNLRKGPLFDLINDAPLYITPDSRLQMITTHEIGRVIDALVSGDNPLNDIFNMGGRGAIEFQRACDALAKPFSVSPEAKRQQYEMDVTKLSQVYPLKTSEEYLLEYLQRNHLLPA